MNCNPISTITASRAGCRRARGAAPRGDRAAVGPPRGAAPTRRRTGGVELEVEQPRPAQRHRREREVRPVAVGRDEGDGALFRDVRGVVGLATEQGAPGEPEHGSRRQRDDPDPDPSRDPPRRAAYTTRRWAAAGVQVLTFDGWGREGRNATCGDMVDVLSFFSLSPLFGRIGSRPPQHPGRALHHRLEDRALATLPVEVRPESGCVLRMAGGEMLHAPLDPAGVATILLPDLTIPRSPPRWRTR